MVDHKEHPRAGVHEALQCRWSEMKPDVLYRCESPGCLFLPATFDPSIDKELIPFE